MSGVYAAIVGLTLVVGFLGLLVVGLLRSQAEILRTINKLGIHLDDDQSAAPIAISTRPATSSVTEVVGVNPDGDALVKSLLSGSDPVLIAFLSTTCTSCAEFWNGIESDEILLHEARYRVFIVTLGPEEESPTRASKLSKGAVDVIMSSDAWNNFEVPGAPYFVVIDPTSGRTIGEGSASTMNALSTFLGDAAGDRRWDAGISDRTDADRERIVDDELRRAGIMPDDPRLYHRRVDDEQG